MKNKIKELQIINQSQLEKNPAFFEKVISLLTFHFSRKRRAFTLAEILITLGIIGVVAALTIPSLIDNYQKHEVPIRLKKMYTTLHNAIRLAEVENGSSENWIFSSDAEAKEFYASQIRTRMNCMKGRPAFLHGSSSNPNGLCHFPDGSMIALSVYRSYGLLELSFYPFTHKEAVRSTMANNPKRHRRYVFGYGIWLSTKNFGWRNSGRQKIESTCMNADVSLLTRENLLNTPKFGVCSETCENGGTRSCFQLIKRDGWKIEKDYPW